MAQFQQTGHNFLFHSCPPRRDHEETFQSRIQLSKHNPTQVLSTSFSLPPLPLRPISMSAQPESLPRSPTAWESTTESRNDSESLPPRIRLKKKRKPFTEFRIIREPAPLQDTTELKPIPSPPWANDSYSLDSPHHLHDDVTRGKRTAGQPSRQENCTYGQKSSAECPAQTIPDEDDEDDTAVASAVLKQLKHSGTETNTFPPPARPSRKQKRYGCDLCGQIFTRSGDVRRHKETRHDDSEGCRCPFCDRVLTR